MLAQFLLPVLAIAAEASAIEVKKPAAQPVYSQNGITVQMLVENSSGAYLGKLRFEPGAKAPAHRHEGSEELITVLSGEGTMTIDGKAVRVGPGDAIRIPANALHDFAAGTAVELMQVYTPGGPEARFRSWPRSQPAK